MNDAAADIIVWGLGTPRTLRVYWALHELGVDYCIESIVTRTASMEREDFLQVSPGSKIPALQHAGLKLTESGAITRYLMDTFDSQQWRASERAVMNRWIFFALTELDATALYVIRRHQGLPEIYGEAPLAVSSAEAYLLRQLTVLEHGISDGRTYVLGPVFCEADIHIGTCLDWATNIGIELPTRLTAYHQQLQARPAYCAAFAANSKAFGT